MDEIKDICPNCNNNENFHYNYDYSSKDLRIEDVLCNECGTFFMPTMRAKGYYLIEFDGKQMIAFYVDGFYGWQLIGSESYYKENEIDKVIKPIEL